MARDTCKSNNCQILESSKDTCNNKIKGVGPLSLSMVSSKRTGGAIDGFIEGRQRGNREYVVIELLEFKPRLAHRPALIAEPTSRDLGGPTRRPGAGRRQEGAGHGGQLGGGPESIGPTFRI